VLNWTWVSPRFGDPKPALVYCPRREYTAITLPAWRSHSKRDQETAAVKASPSSDQMVLVACGRRVANRSSRRLKRQSSRS
jgi:hypothetical protein